MNIQTTIDLTEKELEIVMIGITSVQSRMNTFSVEDILSIYPDMISLCQKLTDAQAKIRKEKGIKEVETKHDNNLLKSPVFKEKL